MAVRTVEIYITYYIKDDFPHLPHTIYQLLFAFDSHLNSQLLAMINNIKKYIVLKDLNSMLFKCILLISNILE